jgi:DNA repair exonuclease SbcCD ATPase subunit
VKVSVKDVVDFYNKFPECIGKLLVETRFGKKIIEYADITAYNSEVYNIQTEHNKSLFCSPNHRVKTDLEWKCVSDILEGDNILTISGMEKVIYKKKEKNKEDLYDFQVAEVKEYYTNGIVSHNSTMLDAIVFGLYGKPFRKINKPQLLNTINQKELLIELEFDVGPNKYLIRRGMKPNIFEIWRDNEMINQDAASRDYQEYLEMSILKMNYKSFSQIVILGSATYVPFMELTAASRREIIEDLLDIQIFTTMNVLLKEKISNNKTEVADNNYNIDLIKSKIESAQENNESIRKMKMVEIDKIKERIRDHLNNIESDSIEIEKIEKEIDEILLTIQDKQNVKSKNDKLKSLKIELEMKKKNFEKELTFYHDHDNCPTCKQGIDHDFKTLTINEKEQKRDEISDAFTQLIEKMNQQEIRLREISDIEDTIQKLHLKAGNHRAQVKISKNTLNSYKNELISAEKKVEEVDFSRIEEYQKQLDTIQKYQTELFEKRETLAVAASMLKDGGIKTRIIRQYLPVMNKLINKYLAAFDLFVDFQLDESFNEIIKSRFRDTFSYASFSEGEKLRISLAIMLTWRAVAKLRNSVSTNLLIMDETLDGALDGLGIENLIDTLHSLNTNDNIFVISHRGQELQDKFQHHIKFAKTKNFSHVLD